MKIRKLPLLLCIILMLTLMSAAVMAAPTQHDISVDPVIIEDCGTDCSGHIITGQASQDTNNIRITGGTHNITLKDLNVSPFQSGGGELTDNDKIQYSALYMATGTKANITIEGNVNFTCDFGIYAKGAELNFCGNADSDFQANGKRFGIYAQEANISFEGGSYYAGTDASEGISTRGGILAGTVTVKNAKLESTSCDVDETDGASTMGIYANELIAENSTLTITAQNAPGGSSIGINTTELFQAKNCNINVNSGDAKETIAIRAQTELDFDNVTLMAKAGDAVNESGGILLLTGTTATINKSTIDATAGEAVTTCGFYAYSHDYTNPTSLTITYSTVNATGGKGSGDDNQSCGLSCVDLTITDSTVTATGNDADTSLGMATYGNYKETDEEGNITYPEYGQATFTNSKIYATAGEAMVLSSAFEGCTLTLKDSEMYVQANNAGNESAEGESSSTRAIITTNLIAENSTIEATTMNSDAAYVYGIYATNEFTLDGANITVNAGNGAYKSYGIRSKAITVKNTYKNNDIKVSTGDAADVYGIYAANEFTIDGADITVNAGNGEYESFGIWSKAATVTIKNSTIDVTAGDADRSYGINAFNSTEGTTATIINSDITATGGTGTTCSIGFDTGDLIVTNSNITAQAGDADNYSYGLSIYDLIATDSNINGIAGNTKTEENEGESRYSEGIFADNIKGTNSNIFGTGGKSVDSIGVDAISILLDGGMISGTADESSKISYGINLDEPASFTLIGADVIAKGGTQGVYANANSKDFSITYKSEENADPEVKSDLSEKELYFGNEYKVIYDANGVDAQMPATETYYNGQQVEVSEAIPTAEGYIFLGWSEDPNAASPEHKAGADSSTSMGTMGNADLTLYAIWQCLGGKTCILNDFTDLVADEWYHDGIHFCLENGYMQGMSKTEFGPDVAATRAMVVTTLWRMDGEWDTEYSNDFTDVPADTWYTEAVNWAAEIGIVKGFGDGSFRPDQPATREELVTILGRFAEYYGCELTTTDIPNEYTDKDKVSSWAEDSMAWAVENGIIKGTSETTLAPQSESTRAQLATVLQRFELKAILGV